MRRQEGKVAAVVLALIAIGALAIHFGKPHLGNPGLTMERVPLTNEFGKIVREERVRLPEKAPGFRSMDGPIMEIEASILPPDTSYGRKIYWDQSGAFIQMSAVMMKTDRTSIHRPQLCVTGQGWHIQKTEIIDIPVPLPAPYLLKATCLTSTKTVRNPKTNEERTASAIYIYWFVSERELLPGHSDALWAITRDLITTGTLYPWAYVSCFATCRPGQEGAYLARMKRLISATVPEFQLMPRPNPKQTAFHSELAPLP
jgi:hypothetical protein